MSTDQIIRYVFLNADGVVVQAIAGSLTQEQVESFLSDYRVLFAAESVVEVPDDATKVWIGGTYEQGAFIPAVVEQPVYVYDSEEVAATSAAESQGEPEA